MDADFERFVRERTPALLRLGYLLTGDQHRAEDLVQAALEKTARRWSHVTSREHPDAYVRQVMYRLQVSEWRRRRIREHPTADLPEPAPHDPQEATDLRLALQQALARLTPRQRAVVVLRYYEDRSEADTALVLGCAVGTVKSQTHLALRRLREANPRLAFMFGEEPHREPNAVR